MNTLNCIVPAPRSIRIESECFKLNKLTFKKYSGDLTVASGYFSDILRSFRISDTVENGNTPSLLLNKNNAIGHEAWEIKITKNEILVSASGNAGFFYASTALHQLLSAASCANWKDAEISCGIINDAPRFKWRAFMLDSGRHFQDVDSVKRTIRLCARMRLNTMHLHLTENESWRLTLDSVQVKPSDDNWDTGKYSKKELREIIDFARENHIQIVPEFDLPGHSRALLKSYPQYTCFHGTNADEICLGNPESLPFLKKIISELMEIFHDSEFFHLGGDEAELTHWQNCPRCLEAVKKYNCNDLRELENVFMRELTSFITANGKTPIVWGTPTSHHDPSTIVQAWMNYGDINRYVREGNRIINSVNQYYYFDYPENLDEPHEVWMTPITEQTIYMSDPYVIWENEWQEKLLGTEACLWSKLVPQWRLMEKILPRIAAFSEVAWSGAGNKNFADFSRRKAILKTAGFEEFLREDFFLNCL